MLLVVFDIDGTLTDTKAVDEECFARALEEVFGLVGVTGATEAYRSSTDPGIAAEAFAAHYGRKPAEEELTRLRERFVELLEGEARRAPERFQALPGAARVVERLHREPGYGPAVATGSWEASGRLKLRAAGLDATDLPAAFADGRPEREDILRQAIARAEACWGPPARAVYVGDGVWDVAAASRLGIPFLGVARKESAAETLRRAGARRVITGYDDWEEFLRALEEAQVPHRKTGADPFFSA